MEVPRVILRFEDRVRATGYFRRNHDLRAVWTTHRRCASGIISGHRQEDREVAAGLNWAAVEL
jgi:hypothetical protein